MAHLLTAAVSSFFLKIAASADPSRELYSSASQSVHFGQSPMPIVACEERKMMMKLTYN